MEISKDDFPIKTSEIKQEELKPDSKSRSWLERVGIKQENIQKAVSIFDKLAFYTILATVFLVPLVFSNQTFDILELPKQVLLGILVMLSIFFWLIKAVLLSEFKLKKSALNIAVIVFLISSAISTIGSTSPVTSFLGFYSRGSDSFLVIIMLTLFFFVAANTIETKNDLKKITGTFLLSIGLVAFYALFQAFGIFILPLEAAKSKMFNTVGGINNLSAILSVALLFSTALIMSSEDKLKISAGILGALSFFLLLGLNTGYIWYGLIFSLLALIGITIVSKKEIDYKLLAIPASILLIAFFMLFSKSFGLSLPKEGQLDRSTAKTIVSSTLTGRFLFGSGPETFVFDYSKFRPKKANKKPTWLLRFDKAHNEYFQMAATRGLLGLLAYLSLFVVLIVLAGTYVMKTEDAFKKSLGVGIFGSSMFLTINSYFYFNNTTLIFIIFVLLSLTSGLRSLEAKEENLVSAQTLEAKTFSIILVLLAFLGVVGATLAGARAYSADAAYKKGLKQSLTIKTVKSAKNNFEKAVALNPYREAYYLNIARVNLILANRESAKKKNKRNVSIMRNKVTTAITSGQKAIDLNPVNAANWMSMALTYRNVALYASDAQPWIEKSYTKAAELEPTNPHPHNGLGQVYLTSKDYDKAITMFEKAIELKDDFADPYFNLGLVYVQKQEYAKARRSFNKVLKLKPNDKETKKALKDLEKLEKGTAVLQKDGAIQEEKPAEAQ
ncbi:MAG: tetratricopeptide repeat protein [Actinobacteria bacterium]|nr:MAG: tetratricopeptide repeat protein [Actinomycetota bacterium]